MVLLLAVVTEVVALHRVALPGPTQATRPVVVRKSTHVSTPPKRVRQIPRPPVPHVPHKPVSIIVKKPRSVSQGFFVHKGK